MSDTGVRIIDREQAVALLEATDRLNDFRGIGSPMGGPPYTARALRLVLDMLDRCTEFRLRPGSVKDYMILEMHSNSGWLTYFVRTEAPREVSWP